MKKKFLTALIIMLLSLNILPVYAAASDAIPTAISEDSVTPASEETVWCTRVHNGVVQMRLWSITYGEWLTDWIDVESA